MCLLLFSDDVDVCRSRKLLIGTGWQQTRPGALKSRGGSFKRGILVGRGGMEWDMVGHSGMGHGGT